MDAQQIWDNTAIRQHRYCHSAAQVLPWDKTGTVNQVARNDEKYQSADENISASGGFIFTG
jgi:hypothetical protein